MRRTAEWLLPEAPAHHIGVDCERFARREQDDVARIRRPRLHVRKDRAERRIDGSRGLRVDRIRLHPLSKYAAALEPRARGLVELARIQAGHAGAIWIRRFGEN